MIAKQAAALHLRLINHRETSATKYKLVQAQKYSNSKNNHRSITKKTLIKVRASHITTEVRKNQGAINELMNFSFKNKIISLLNFS